jgi:hypothetical protein
MQEGMAALLPEAGGVVSTARWRHQSADVPLDTVTVYPPYVSRRGGFDVQLGSQVLWVESLSHWQDINEKVLAAFTSLPAVRGVPARKDGMKANVAGACWGDDE